MGIRIGRLEDCHKLSEPTVDTARCHAVPHVSKMLDVNRAYLRGISIVSVSGKSKSSLLTSCATRLPWRARASGAWPQHTDRRVALVLGYGNCDGNATE